MTSHHRVLDCLRHLMNGVYIGVLVKAVVKWALKDERHASESQRDELRNIVEACISEREHLRHGLIVPNLDYFRVGGDSTGTSTRRQKTFEKPTHNAQTGHASTRLRNSDRIVESIADVLDCVFKFACGFRIAAIYGNHAGIAVTKFYSRLTDVCSVVMNWTARVLSLGSAPVL